MAARLKKLESNEKKSFTGKTVPPQNKELGGFLGK